MKTLAAIPAYNLGSDFSRCYAEVLLGSVRRHWQLRWQENREKTATTRSIIAGMQSSRLGMNAY